LSRRSAEREGGPHSRGSAAHRRVVHENADKWPDLQRFWEESKEKEIQTIERLKELIRDHVRKENF
jgi:hypothetical protein